MTYTPLKLIRYPFPYQTLSGVFATNSGIASHAALPHPLAYTPFPYLVTYTPLKLIRYRGIKPYNGALKVKFSHRSLPRGFAPSGSASLDIYAYLRSQIQQKVKVKAKTT